MSRIASLSIVLLLYMFAAVPVEGLEKHLPFSISKSTERVVLLFHDDSSRSKKVLSQLRIVQDHFEELDRKQQQQQGEQESDLTKMVSFVTVNATETAGKEFAKDYMVSFYPTTKWIVHGVTCDFLGGTSSKSMIEWIQARLDGAVAFVEHVDDDNIFEQQIVDAKADGDVAIVGFFPSLDDIPPAPWSPLSIFVAVAQEDHSVKCRFLAFQDTPQTRQAVLGHGEHEQQDQKIVYAIHRYYNEEEEPIPFEYSKEDEFGRLALHRFVKKHRVPLLLPILTQSTWTSVFDRETHQHLVFVFLNSVQHSKDFLQNVVEPVAHEFIDHEDPMLKIEHVRFIVVPYIVGDAMTAKLWEFFQMGPADPDLPAFVMFDLDQPRDGIYVKMDSYMHRIPKPEEGYTKEGLRHYVKNFIHLYDGTIRYHQLDHPQPEPKPLGIHYIDDGFNYN